MTPSEKKRAGIIIHTSAVAAAAAGSGLANIPGSDCAVIIPIQVSMIVSLGSIFGRSIDKSAAKAILACHIATISGRAISQIFTGFIPIVGNIWNAGTAAGVTEIIGWAVVKDFENEKRKEIENGNYSAITGD